MCVIQERVLRPLLPPQGEYGHLLTESQYVIMDKAGCSTTQAQQPGDTRAQWRVAW